MKKQTSKQEKPVILGSTPSANWKRFLAANKVDHQKKRIKEKKMNVHSHLSLMQDEDDPISKLLNRLPQAVGIDCEMVGVASPLRDMLARVSIVNMDGDCIYDKFVLPTQEVLDYRTWVSGIRPHDLKNGESFDVVREEVEKLLKNKIVIGHAVTNDFRALKIKIPKYLVRDTSHFPPFIKLFNGKTPSLRNLSRVVLGVNIQSGEHSSVQDAKAAIQLYMIYRREWEDYIIKKSSVFRHKLQKKKMMKSSAETL